MSASSATVSGGAVRAGRLEHVELGEWRDFLQRRGLGRYAIKKQTYHYQHFRDRWPELASWAAEPLEVRLGRVDGDGTGSAVTDPASYRARSYLQYLALTGRAAYDWDFALAAEAPDLLDYGEVLGLPFNRTWWEGQRAEAVKYGWAAGSIGSAVVFAYTRFVLHRGDPDVNRYGLEDLQELRDQLVALNARLATLKLRGSGDPAVRLNTALGRVTALHGFWFCQGKTDVPYTRPFRRNNPPDDWAGPPQMAAVIERYCNQHLRIDDPTKVKVRRRELRLFTEWLCDRHPTIVSFAEVTRVDVEAYLEHLRVAPRPKLNRPLAINTRRGVISILRQFFEETAAWEYDDVPGRQMVTRADAPRAPLHVPRFIPQHELERVMQAIRELPDVHQRAALLIVRWSGARRDEIRHLELDCLDSYPDGTPRLRIPPGKTKVERMVPIAAEAAEAIREIQAQRAVDRDLGIFDPGADRRVRYLFMDRGRLRSAAYLYDEPLLQASHVAGLEPVTGRGNAVTAHRFRHSVGTQLGENQARISTIMAILGHASANMAMVYTAISDPEVLQDYAHALKPGQVLAGPAAQAIRNRELSAQQLDWLNSNFLKSELELGACLKLPEEGPCECELYLTCAKFFTTTEHAPRLRRRWHREQQLIEDATDRGWPREAERHQALAQRCLDLLAELGEPLEGETDEGQPLC